jgi:hypothetical protein
MLTLAYQVPYMVAFSAGTYHFPVVWLLMPLASAGLSYLYPFDREKWRALHGRRWIWVVVLVLLLVQIEYAYWAVIMR